MTATATPAATSKQPAICLTVYLLFKMKTENISCHTKNVCKYANRVLRSKENLDLLLKCNTLCGSYVERISSSKPSAKKNSWTNHISQSNKWSACSSDREGQWTGLLKGSYHFLGNSKGSTWFNRGMAGPGSMAVEDAQNLAELNTNSTQPA